MIFLGKGDYDFESLYALNISMLNEQLNALLAGKEVELPKYNFQTGKSEKSGRMLQLKGNAVVGTVMTNMGFQKFCEEKGLRFEATKVGDRYVLEEMQLSGYNIGGEQSGHIIFSDYATTGDGQLTGVQLMSIMKRRNETLSEMAKVMKRYPQVLINVKISNEMKPKFYTDKHIKAEIQQVTDILGNRGRILIRVSGTEPLVHDSIGI